MEAEKSDFLITKHGRCLDLIRLGGSIFGVDTGDRDEEEPYVVVDQRDLIQYRFNWEPWLRKVREVNRLNGGSSWLHPSLAFLGEKINGDGRLGIVIGFFSRQDAAMDLLLSLPARMPSIYSILAVTTLTFDQLPQQDIATLERLGVYVVAPIDRRTLEIKTLHLVPRKPIQMSPVPVGAHTGKLRQHSYKTQLPVLITGDTKKWHRNIVIVNGLPVALGDRLFLIFLRLCIQLIRYGSGVSKAGLRSGGHCRSGSEEQTIGRLRNAFTIILGKRVTHDFIERYGRGMIRLSTLPDLVKYNKERLRSHGNEKVQRLAKELPDY